MGDKYPQIMIGRKQIEQCNVQLLYSPTFIIAECTFKCRCLIRHFDALSNNWNSGRKTLLIALLLIKCLCLITFRILNNAEPQIAFNGFVYHQNRHQCIYDLAAAYHNSPGIQSIQQRQIYFLHFFPGKYIYFFNKYYLLRGYNWEN